jgi:hypothetical protein
MKEDLEGDCMFWGVPGSRLPERMQENTWGHHNTVQVEIALSIKARYLQLRTPMT